MPRLSDADLSRSATPDELMDDIPASIPPTQTKDDEAAEEQLEQELVETTEPKSAKKGKAATRKEKPSKAKAPEPVANGNSDGEEEYDVESIVTHIFRGKKVLYKVRWVGYTEVDDTWEPEEHLVPESASLLAAYHKRIGGAPQPPTKQPRKTTSKANLKEESPATKDEDSAEPAAKRTKRSHRSTSNLIEPGTQEWEKQPLSAWVPTDKGSWEDLIHEVETVERDEEGNLYAYIRFRNGKRSKVANNLYSSRCPRAMLRFYENHLSV